MNTPRRSRGIDEAYRRADHAVEANASELDLSGLELPSVPDHVWNLANLIFLDLSNNCITDLPGAMGRLARLEILNIKSNQLRRLPENLDRLTSLKRLDASYNLLSRFDHVIRVCRNLRELILNGNDLHQIDFILHDELTFVAAHCDKLELLHLSRARLREIPSVVFQLKSLVEPDLSDNNITEIPYSLSNLCNLLSLDMRDNDLGTLPNNLTGLSKLRSLYLHGNSKLHIPTEILGPTPLQVNLSRATPAPPGNIISYYLRIMNTPRPLNEAKLIIVGFGEVGKTSIVNKLVFNSFYPQQEKTDGINICDWPVTLGPDDEVCLHIWDFGGQEIMHATHQFFLTRRSLYLVVLNGRQGQENTDAAYWLSIIDSFAPDCPIIIVLNKVGVTSV